MAMMSRYKIRKRWMELYPYLSDVDFSILDAITLSLAPAVCEEFVNGKNVCIVTVPNMVDYFDEEALDEWLGGVKEYLTGESDKPRVVGPAVCSCLTSIPFRHLLNKKVLQFNGWSPSQQFRHSLNSRFAAQSIAVRERVPSASRNLRGLQIYPRPSKADPAEDAPVSISYMAGLMLVDGPALSGNKDLVELIVGFYMFRLGAMQVLPTGEVELPGLDVFLDVMPNRMTNERLIREMNEKKWVVPGVTV